MIIKNPIVIVWGMGIFSWEIELWAWAMGILGVGIF